MKSFQQRVVEVVKQIPKGEVLTYGEVAKLSGNEKASRAVGTIMAKNKDKTISCHRVVRSDGSLGMYNGLQGKSKKGILEKEGVIFNKNSKVVI